MMIASKTPCFSCFKSLSRSLLKERSIQGLRLISMHSISRLRLSVAQSCLKQLCKSQRLGVPEKRHRTRKDLLAATGVDNGGVIGRGSDDPGQALAPCVSTTTIHSFQSDLPLFLFWLACELGQDGHQTNVVGQPWSPLSIGGRSLGRLAQQQCRSRGAI